MPSYRNPVPTLEQLLAELQPIVAGHGPVEPGELVEANTWLRLPRYRREATPSRARSLLLKDLRGAIETMGSPAREHLRLLFREDESDLRITKRREAALDLYESKYAGAAGMFKHQEVVSQLAFAVFVTAQDWIEPDEELDFGFRSVAHDWSVDLESADGETTTYTFRSWARATRPGQRFYVFGGDLDGADLADEPWIPIDRENAGQIYVGTVPVDPSTPDVILHVVYLGRAYGTDDEVEVAVCRRVHERSGSGGQSGLFFESRGPDIRNVTLSVRSRWQNLVDINAIERKDKGVLPRSDPYPSDTPPTPTDKASVRFEPITEGNEYELTWSLARGDR